MPISVLGFYGAVALWAVLIARGVFKPKQWPLIAGFGLVLLLFLNVRYLIDGAPAGIAFFISLYDFFDNLGLSAGEVPSAMGTAFAAASVPAAPSNASDGDFGGVHVSSSGRGFAVVGGRMGSRCCQKALQCRVCRWPLTSRRCSTQ